MTSYIWLNSLHWTKYLVSFVWHRWLKLGNKMIFQYRSLSPIYTKQQSSLTTDKRCLESIKKETVTSLRTNWPTGWAMKVQLIEGLFVQLITWICYCMMHPSVTFDLLFALGIKPSDITIFHAWLPKSTKCLAYFSLLYGNWANPMKH